MTKQDSLHAKFICLRTLQSTRWLPEIPSHRLLVTLWSVLLVRHATPPASRNVRRPLVHWWQMPLFFNWQSPVFLLPAASVFHCPKYIVDSHCAIFRLITTKGFLAHTYSHPPNQDHPAPTIWHCSLAFDRGFGTRSSTLLVLPPPAPPRHLGNH